MATQSTRTKLSARLDELDPRTRVLGRTVSSAESDFVGVGVRDLDDGGGGRELFQNRSGLRSRLESRGREMERAWRARSSDCGGARGLSSHSGS